MNGKLRFRIFDMQVQKFAKALVPDFTIKVLWGDKMSESTIAETHLQAFDLSARFAEVYFNGTFVPLSKEDLTRTAYHEVLHIMFHRVDTHLRSQYAEPVCNELLHEIIARLENNLEV